MPVKQRKYCNQVGCSNFAENGNYCAEHVPTTIRVKKSYEKWYGKKAWQTIRTSQLIKEPLCKHCRENGILTKATEVDHIIPHRGDYKQFINRNNLQSLCTPCHSRKTRAENGRTYR